MVGLKFRGLGCAICGALVLSGCEEGQMPSFLKPSEESTTQTQAPASVSQFEEREVEAPEVFQVTETGLWDGRPDFGGVWLAYPGVSTPEQVIIRNEETGSFVVGALFDRSRDNPGPRFTVSSDAASALGLLAGQPTLLNVTALRRKEVEIQPEPSQETTDIETPEDISVAALDDSGDIAATAAAAIERAEDTPAPVAAAPATSNLSQPFVQIGIFSVQENAERTVANLENAGVSAQIKPGQINDKPFWSIIIGPAANATDRDALLETAKDLGFVDAYFVNN